MAAFADPAPLGNSEEEEMKMNAPEPESLEPLESQAHPESQSPPRANCHAAELTAADVTLNIDTDIPGASNGVSPSRPDASYQVWDLLCRLIYSLAVEVTHDDVAQWMGRHLSNLPDYEQYGAATIDATGICHALVENSHKIITALMVARDLVGTGVARAEQALPNDKKEEEGDLARANRRETAARGTISSLAGGPTRSSRNIPAAITPAAHKRPETSSTDSASSPTSSSSSSPSPVPRRPLKRKASNAGSRESGTGRRLRQRSDADGRQQRRHPGTQSRPVDLTETL